MTPDRARKSRLRRWSHRLNPAPREANIKAIYAGGEASRELLARYDVDYVVVGPLERDQLRVNEPFFEQFPAIGASMRYRLYRVKHVQR